ncbi:unnamed protein product [Ilex paraguariensis]|uniref:Uncharacterized protein n=1 Tax=Ilex paraguariensis TaxID=185542 RepID=A0ABC8RXK6_9AQUA
MPFHDFEHKVTFPCKELVRNLQPLRFKDLPISNFGPLDDLLQLSEIVCDIKTSAIILNTMDFLECSSLAQLQKHCQVPFFSVGPLHKMAPSSSSTNLLQEDIKCIAWLDKQAPNSVLYVSLGSLVTMDEKELIEIAWGLANSDHPFLRVVRFGSIHGAKGVDLLPLGFREIIAERGCIVKWAPQKEVISHNAVGGFWRHCGWNSTLESIFEGVPMICRPCFEDQRVNTRYLCHVLRVGLELEHASDREEIERAIKRLLVEKEGEETRQRAIDMKEKVKVSVGKCGSSGKSLNDLTEFILSFLLPK